MAAGLHQIRLMLFQFGLCSHDPTTTGGLGVDAVTSWERPPDQWARVVRHPTLFTQPHFSSHQQHRDGIANIVGYWAQYRILGGVSLFDHSKKWGDESSEPNTYVQCNRARVTYHICQLVFSTSFV